MFRILLAVGVMIGLTACSGSWSDYNPMNWFGSDEQEMSDELDAMSEEGATVEE